MANPSNAHNNRAQNLFRSSVQREDAIRLEIEKQRVTVEAKTARLKALRLAKEAQDKIEADRLAAENVEKKARIAAQKFAARAGKRPD